MKTTVFISAVLLVTGLAFADWPEFQGPNHNGVSIEKVKLADTWPAAGPRVAWKNERMGTGYAGAVIQKGKVYVLDRVDDQKDVLRCLDLATGKEEWTYAYDCPGKYKGNYNGSRNQPAVDDTYVFTLGPFGHLTCISKATHTAVWQKNIVDEYGATITNWGLCQSPALYKNTIIVAPMSDKAGAVAFSKADGKEMWKSAPVGSYCWTSPLVTAVDGQDMVMLLTTRDTPRLSGIDAAAGTVLWEYRGWRCPNPIASPICLPDGRVFITGGYGAGCAMVKVTRNGTAWKAEEVFSNRNLSSQAQNPVFYNKCIFANSSGNRSGIMCLDPAGEVKWKTENKDAEEIGAILVADGKLFSFLSQTGILRMFAATGDSCRELASAKVADGAENWGVMAYTDGRLIIRARRTLICLDLR